MLFSMPDIAGLELRVVDVVSDDDLLERYGERVPVLQLFTDDDSGPQLVLDLPWPFSAESVGAELRKL